MHPHIGCVRITALASLLRRISIVNGRRVSNAFMIGDDPGAGREHWPEGLGPALLKSLEDLERVMQACEEMHPRARPGCCIASEVPGTGVSILFMSSVFCTDVPNVREGEGDDLSCVGRVRKHLLGLDRREWLVCCVKGKPSSVAFAGSRPAPRRHEF